MEIDLITGRVPYQPWSIAGKLQGLDDPRGQLWNDVSRVLASLILEIPLSTVRLASVAPEYRAIIDNLPYF